MVGCVSGRGLDVHTYCRCLCGRTGSVCVGRVCDNKAGTFEWV